MAATTEQTEETAINSMPQSQPGRRITVGADTHKDVHVAVACDQLGVRLDELHIPTTSSGYDQLVHWIADTLCTKHADQGRASDGLAYLDGLKVNRGEERACRVPTGPTCAVRLPATCRVQLVTTHQPPAPRRSDVRFALIPAPDRPGPSSCTPPALSRAV